ncbi:MAG TPA: acetyl-CoA carboxylase biotin carboxyl carrier protein [Phycisphaerales bacterium]|nr:acetyl-CoA carboxylase biotin carboxyl carrier protein [Phycisphaerales bacterium]
MIDIRKLKELVRLMVENDLSELDLRDQQETVTIKRGPSGIVMAPAYPHAGMAGAGGVPGAEPSPATDNGAARAADDDDAGLVAIESPMVGTFYSAATPDAEPFISVGSSVSADTVVCLVEAMKVFNEIKAECAGTVERVLVNNGEAVEFGQKLFLIRPA